MAEARGRDLWGHTSAVLALVANCNRDPKRSRPFSPVDFNPYAAKRRISGVPITAENIGILKAFVKKKGSGS